MSRSDLKPILEAVNAPVVMGRWGDDEVPVWPFVEYHRDEDNNVKADNSNYRRIDQWAIRVYAHDDDMAGFYDICDSLEASLDSNAIPADRHGDIFTGEGTVYAEYSFQLPR